MNFNTHPNTIILLEFFAEAGSIISIIFMTYFLLLNPEVLEKINNTTFLISMYLLLGFSIIIKILLRTNLSSSHSNSS